MYSPACHILCSSQSPESVRIRLYFRTLHSRVIQQFRISFSEQQRIRLSLNNPKNKLKRDPVKKIYMEKK